MNDSMRRVLLGGLLLVVLGVPVQAQTLAEKLADARLAARAEVALAQDAALRAFTFRPTSEAGVLTVVGVVATEEQRGRVAEVVSRIEGVTQVVNNVQVTGTAGQAVLPADTTGASGSKEEPAPEPEPEALYHTVRSGDTLGAIAQRYGVAIRQVQQLNGLRGSQIRVGQRLRVK